ncbi:holo-[acyl-carrier protein] synthase [Bifidobacterium commune]|uniref:Holo-[acyl-carrier-protein] synthase n=2 Tax=Bifidobacterium commune TaxID=1505727 RepID=A0A1C4H020_9BIFI|nr:4'-phosphopantetheinyl transferase superfamily protein [Bifidobacterium commune]MBB2955324.1 holo-[acyl-carrier protein] synthase [Bifidobacterium commune]SCC77948.1 holo-[acyl-carrier protein] synthase [Bifidobacterium commune]
MPPNSYAAVLGLGHDVVDVGGFAAQLDQPGSRMRRLFSARELRQSAMRANAKHDDEAAHLAVRWAGKEAVLKAWCEALGERANPYTLDDFPWSEVEILDDSHSRPHVMLSAQCDAMLRESLCVLTSHEVKPARRERSVTNASISVDEKGSETFSEGSIVGDRVTAFDASLRWHISLSHDGTIASAVVILVCVGA